jgi:hypothetical protein
VIFDKNRYKSIKSKRYLSALVLTDAAAGPVSEPYLSAMSEEITPSIDIIIWQSRYIF